MEVCFIESLCFIFNVVRRCDLVGVNIICIYVCKVGFIYYDGIIFKEYNCLGVNKWFLIVNLEDCLCKYFNVVISI